MLIELLSTSNYVSFNIKVAEILGLKAAIYLSELMNINDKAIRKDKIDESSFTLDRDYMARRTTLTIDEQLEIEMNLVKLGIIEKKDSARDCIILHLNILTTIMMEPDESLIGSIKRLSAPKRSKKEAIAYNLKASIVTSNVELREAYGEWIDSVIAKQGWMQKPSVVMGQSLVDEYSGRNLDIALRIVNIAAMHGYRDMQWAINAYERDHKNAMYHTSQHQYSMPVVSNPEVSSEVF